MASASDFNIFINFYINRIYLCKISSNKQIIPKNKINNSYAFLIPSFPKTGTTSLIHSLGKNFVPVVKLNYLKLNPKFENIKNHLSIHQNQNLNNKKFIKNYSEIEEPDGDINIFCDYLYFNKYKNSFKHKIYLTVFRDFRTLITSYYFQFNGEKYFSNSYERNQIKLEILKEINKFMLFYEKWLENFVNDYNLDFSLTKKIDNGYLLNKPNEKFYFINLNNLETFYKDNLVKEYSISNDFINENLSENKNYSKLYEDVKNDIFAELKNYNFEKFKYVNIIQKMFFNKI